MSSALYITHPHLAPELEKIETAAHRAGAREALDELLAMFQRNYDDLDALEMFDAIKNARARYAGPEEEKKG